MKDILKFLAYFVFFGIATILGLGCLFFLIIAREYLTASVLFILSLAFLFLAIQFDSE